jgi:hypothetical protein
MESLSGREAGVCGEEHCDAGADEVCAGVCEAV